MKTRMKFLFATLFFLFFSISSTLAQLDFGVKLGYNSSLSLESTNADFKAYNYKKISSEFRNNYHLGVFFRFSGNRLFVQPEMLYVREYSDYEIKLKDITESSSGKNFVSSLELSMFEFPVLLGFKLIKTKNSGLNIYFGPLLRAQQKSSATTYDTNKTEDLFYEQIKKMDVGVALGVSIDFRNFLLDIRYNINQTPYENSMLKALPASNMIFSLGYRIL